MSKLKQQNIVPKKPAVFLLTYGLLTVAVVHGYALLQGESTGNAEALDILLQFLGGIPSLHGLYILLEKLARGQPRWLGYDLAIYGLPLLFGLILPKGGGMAHRDILSYLQGSAILILAEKEKGES